MFVLTKIHDISRVTHRNLTSVAKLYLGRDFDIHNSPLEEKKLLSPILESREGLAKGENFNGGPKNGVIDI